MFSLPNTRGGFSVGATTFISPVRTGLVIGSGTLPGQSQPGFILDELAFTAYYPAEISSKVPRKGVDWLIRPVSDSLRGFARFSGVSRWLLWPVVYLVGQFLKIPLYRDAPLQRNKAGGKPWPLVIFSHGLGGSRYAYSHICSQLAASGNVVLAIEHRDGSGHASVSNGWPPEIAPRVMLYLQEEDVKYNNSDEPTPLRSDQLLFRRHEIYGVYSTFCQFMDGDESLEIKALGSDIMNRSSWTALDSEGQATVQYQKDVCLAGHSFGGCTVFSVLSEPSPLPSIPALPITKCLVYDPWLEPIPTPGPAFLIPTLSTSISSDPALPSTRSSYDAPTLVDTAPARDANRRPEILLVHSQTWTLWNDHFERLKGVLSDWDPNGRLVTLVASQHHSFSDFVILPVVRTKDAQRIMDAITRLSVSFLQGNLEEELKVMSTRPMEVKVVGKRKDGRPKRQLVGVAGDIIVH